MKQRKPFETLVFLRNVKYQVVGCPCLKRRFCRVKSLVFRLFPPLFFKIQPRFQFNQKIAQQDRSHRFNKCLKILDDFLILESSTEDQLYRLLFMCRNFFYPYSFHVQFNPNSLSKNYNQTPPSADAMGIIKKKTL